MQRIIQLLTLVMHKKKAPADNASTLSFSLVKEGY